MRASVRSHFNVTAHTRNATCEETALYEPAVPEVPPCSGGIDCSFQFFTGEIFLALSPSYMFSASLGTLKTGSTHISLTLVDGWDACMPTQPAPGIHPVDGLFSWMMHQAGRNGGFVAREHWPAYSRTPNVRGNISLPDGVDNNEDKRWTVLDLTPCGVGASDVGDGSCSIAEYTPSNRLLIFYGVYFFTLFWSIGAVYFFYTKWMSQQGDKTKAMGSMLVNLDADHLERKRAAAFANDCRQEAMSAHPLFVLPLPRARVGKEGGRVL